METRAAMQQLAPLVAKAEGHRRDRLPRRDPRAEEGQHRQRPARGATTARSSTRSIRSSASSASSTCRNRPMQMRLGQPAESAAQPAPHFLPAPLVGNTGQQGTFVLPLGNPDAGPDAAYDDFNFPSVAWTLTRARRPSRPRAAVHRDGRARHLAGAHAVRVQLGQRRRLGAVRRGRDGAVRAARRPADRAAVPPDARRARDARPDAQPGPDRPRTRRQGAAPTTWRCRRRWRGRNSTATPSTRPARPAATSTATAASWNCAWRPNSRWATSSTAWRSTTSCSTRACCRRTCWPRRCASSSFRRSRRKR